VPTLRTLGGIELLGGATGTLTPRRRELVLLSYLARRAPRPVSRQELAALLWGDRDEAKARHSLRQALLELRAEVGESLEIDGDTVRVIPDRLELDVRAFDLAVDAGRPEQAAAVWQGDFLAGCDELGTEELRTWIEQERAGLRKKLAWAYRSLVERARAQGDARAAVALSERWCAALPYDETAHRAVVESLRIAGQATEADARHASFLTRLRASGIPPSAEIRRLGDAAAQEPARLGGRGLLSPDLVGRSEALGELASVWHAVTGGAGRVAVILGGDGEGKSRLCREFARQLRSRAGRATIAEGRAFEAERERPWSAIRPLLAGVSDAPGFRAAPASALVSAAALVPEIRERLPSLHSAGEELHPTAAVVRILTEVAAEQPLLVLIDDAASSDAASLEVIGSLVRRPPASCLLVLADRPEALYASPLDQDLRQGSEHVVRVDLDPLDLDAIELMVSSMLPLAPGASRAVAERLRRESSGSPGQIVSLVHGWVDAGVLVPGPDGRWIPSRSLEGHLPLPAELRDAVAAKLTRLGPDARATIEAAALFHGEIEPEALEYVTGLPRERFSAALGELLSHRLLRDRGLRQYEFASEPARRAMYEGLGRSRRRKLARRLRDARLGASPVRRRPVWLAAGIAVALLLVWRLSRPGAAELEQGGQIVLADVSNATADSGLGPAFYAAATTGLQGSRYLSLFPRHRVRETLARMGKPVTDTALSEPLAREVAVREGIAVVVALGIAQVDSTYLLTARLVDPESGRDLAANSVRVPARAGLLEGMDDLLGNIRRALGESRSVQNRNPEPLPRVTTSSLDALRAYVAGSDAWTRRDFGAAQVQWERALALDSTFALAMAGLADLWYVGHNDRPRGNQWMAQALAQVGRLTERERLRIQGQAAQRQGRDWEAESYYRMLAERYPSRDTWYSHGSVLLGQYRCREAIPSFRRALEFDSLFTNGHLSLATCLQLAGPIEESLAAYAAAGRSDSLALFRGNINHEWGTGLVRAGRPEAAESAYRRMTEQGRPGERARGFRSLAWLEIYRGRFRRAVSHLEEAIRLNHADAVALSILRNQVILSQTLLALGEDRRGLRMLDSATARARALQPAPAFMLYLGMAQLRAGRIAAASASLAAVNAAMIPTALNDRAVRQGLESHVLLARGDPAGALTAAHPFYDDRQAAFRLSALALAYGATRQPDSALAVAVRLSDTFAFGEESQFEWQRGPLLVARFAEAKGDSATARAAYTRFIEQWRGGDQDLPDLVLARRNLLRLQPMNR
jgi:DNA-binding SARP family transcriptional activator/Tfp pilus assembly protein PilF